MTGTMGLWMLVALGALVVTTGLPVWALLVGVASAFATGGVATGVFEVPVLSVAGSRLINLLEHDLLQALPLYVFVGVLLQRMFVADALFSSLVRLLRPLGAPSPLAALAVGTFIAPMNGSVASSSALLSRLVAPRLANLPAAKAVSLVSVAATIGVVVPPSLVLILLGDAMMRAHTEAGHLTDSIVSTQRIVNTQDVLHAALAPAALILLLWAAIAWLQDRRTKELSASNANARDMTIAAIAVAVIVTLLGGVFLGKFFAVEAAAAGGCLLVATALVTRALDRRAWTQVLLETMALSGALFALLIGATTFSLVFRLFGTDRWIADAVASSPWPPHVTSAAVLVFVALCAWVLDAFEMIFVVVPIVAPPLIVQLGDAQQVAVLLLLVLQLSFLLPPMGYAVLMARARSGLARVGNVALAKSLAPFIAVQALVAIAVFLWPAGVHWLDAPVEVSAPSTPASEQDIVRQMEEMAREPDDPASQPSK